jgi:CheY-like chemotaxis protein
MKVLIIEDSAWNLGEDSTAAIQLHHEVTILTSAAEAMELLRDEQKVKEFDFVLTDLYLPGPGTKDLMPIGMAIAIAAANAGVRAAIVTDADHHQDLMVAMLDVCDPIKLISPIHGDQGSALIRKLEARMVCVSGKSWDPESERIVDGDDGRLVKDWDAALRVSLDSTE